MEASQLMEDVLSQVFLIVGMVVIIVLGILWVTVLLKKTTNPYPIVPMISVTFIAQAIGLFAFFS